MKGDFLLDAYVSVKPGEPYRLFPFGKIYKAGKAREITPAYAATFKLPHFKPAIKLGSHEETTPAGGHIVGLEVRADGLYAIPEMNDNGVEALQEGAYRYHSPEVIWEGGGFEDPTTGQVITGPLIIGDALLHNPHLGEAAALYEVQAMDKEKGMEPETVNIPKDLWEKVKDLFGAKPAAEPVEVIKPEQLTALAGERDQYKAKAEHLEAEKAQFAAQQAAQKLRGDLVAELQKPERFGSYYVEMREAGETADMLAGMTPEQRDWCMRKFSAFAMQVKSGALFSEKGSSGGGTDDPAAALDAAVKAKAAEKSVDYVTALGMVQAEKPELFQAYARKEK